jgi:hypothetical protein
MFQESALGHGFQGLQSHQPGVIAQINGIFQQFPLLSPARRGALFSFKKYFLVKIQKKPDLPKKRFNFFLKMTMSSQRPNFPEPPKRDFWVLAGSTFARPDRYRASEGISFGAFFLAGFWATTLS